MTTIKQPNRTGFWPRLDLRNWPLVRKLSFILLLAVLIPMIGTAIFNLTNSLRALESTERENLQLLASSIAKQLDQLLQDGQIAAGQISADYEVYRYLETPDSAELRTSIIRSFDGILAANSDYEYVYLLDANGNTLISRQWESLPSIEGRDLSDRAYFRQAINNEPYIDVLVGRSSKRLGFYFSNPVVNENNEAAGVIVVKVQGEAITDIINEFNEGANSNFAFLTDHDGVIVSHPDPSWLLRSVELISPSSAEALRVRFCGDDLDCSVSYLGVPELRLLATNARSGGIEYAWPGDGTDLAGEQQILGFAKTVYLDWTVAVNVERAEFSRPLNELFLQSGISVLIVSAVMILLALVVARSIARPLNRLALAASDVENERPFEPSDISQVLSLRDEVGNLARVFCNMVLSLRARMAELRTIYDIANTISANVELEPTINTILCALREVIAFDSAEICLYDNTGSKLILHATNHNLNTTIDHNATGKFMVSGEFFPCLNSPDEALLIANTHTETEHNIHPERGWNHEEPMSYLGVPLRNGLVVTGVIELLSNQPDTFSKSDLRILESVSTQATIAIRNAHQVLHREIRLKQQIEQLRIEIDESKRSEQVDEIVNSDYFQQLRRKAGQLRQRNGGNGTVKARIS